MCVKFAFNDNQYHVLHLLLIAADEKRKVRERESVCALKIVKNVLGSEAYLKHGEKETKKKSKVKSTSTAGHILNWFGLQA